MMISISELIQDLESSLGRSLELSKHGVGIETCYSVRFVDVIPAQSFSMIFQRGWKSTSATFQSDPFAAQVASYLAEQASAKRLEIINCLSENRAVFSSVEMLVDGFSITDVKLLMDTPKRTFAYQADILCSESAFEHGILNERERSLIDVTLNVFSLLLPNSLHESKSPEEVFGYPEGAVTKVSVNRYERDPRNRAEAIQIHGTICQVCGFDFHEIYGSLGNNYIVVHHVVPVSQLGDSYKIDPRTDLTTLCANCHSMIHRKNPPLTLDQLREKLSPRK